MKDRPTPRRPRRSQPDDRWRPSRSFWWALALIVLGAAVALRALVTGEYRHDIPVTPTDLPTAALIVGTAAVAATLCAAAGDRYAGRRKDRRP